jgi:hypothetical protein
LFFEAELRSVGLTVITGFDAIDGKYEGLIERGEDETRVGVVGTTLGMKK